MLRRGHRASQARKLAAVHTAGSAVEVVERRAAIDLAIVVEFGVAITDLAHAIRRNVIGALERMTGLEVAVLDQD
jgi:uncharacterized alkaline shock family protein YloU